MGDAVDLPDRPQRAAYEIRKDGLSQGDLLTEVGSTGLLRFGGFVDEEFLPQLKNVKGRQTIREMIENEAVIGAGLLAIDLLFRQVQFSMKPASDQPADVEVSDFVWSCFHDMEDTWPDTLSAILSFLPFGWAWHEEVYKWRRGDVGQDDGTESKHADGLLGWKGLPGRAQETLYKWEFDQGGRAQAMVQQAAPDYTFRVVPHAKSLHFRTSTQKNNPEGHPILRTAYRAWYMKRRIEELEGIGVERDLAGLPVMKVPVAILSKNATDRDATLRESLKKMVRQVRRNEAEGLLVPSDVDENGHDLYEFTLLSSGGARQIDTDKVISRYDQRIGMSMLTDFMLLGHEGEGGGGGLGVTLGASKIDLLTVALSTWVGMVMAEFNDRAIPHLLRYNGLPVEAAPTLEAGNIESADLNVIGNYVRNLAAGGVFLGADNPAAVEYLASLAEIPYEPSTQEM